MKAMLLAAGRSSRLGALGQTLPKPIIPVCGYPAIVFGLAACARAGISHVVVNVHHHGDLIRDTLGDGQTFGLRIDYSVEPELLGTGGGIARARDLLGEGPLLVMNAKVVADADLAALIDAHTISGADATLMVRDDPEARKWGAIGSDEEGGVTTILDAQSPRPASGRVIERMFTGIQIIGPAIRDRLRPVFSDSVRDGYIPALRLGATIRSFVLPGYFAEHSTPERYLAGNLALLRQPSLLTHPPGPLVGIDPGAQIHAQAILQQPIRIARGAIVESRATVGPGVVVGAGATVAADAHVTQSVLWPGARAEGRITDAILTGTTETITTIKTS